MTTTTCDICGATFPAETGIFNEVETTVRLRTGETKVVRFNVDNQDDKSDDDFCESCMKNIMREGHWS